EDVVRGERDERRTERGHVRGSTDVDRRCTLRICLGAFDIGPPCRMEDEVVCASLDALARGMRDVPVLATEGDDVVVGKCALERLAELTTRARDEHCTQDGAVASRAERIGSDVFHRCTTRGSFQATVCSSGSVGSNSVVTW